ncbi:MAG: inositol 2-dehydrogenase [Alphaproteobacteria bacterium]
MNPINNSVTTIAVIGCGRIGRMHVRNIYNHPQARLGPIYDPKTPNLKEIADQYHTRTTSSAEEIFSDPSVDAVLIASSTDTHADYIEQAVNAEKPVLCEKPIDLSLARVNQCAAAIKGRKAHIQLGFNRRFDPGHRATRNALRNGEIGDLHQVIISSRDPEMPPREYLTVAGGLFKDMTIHDFDLARVFLGSEPVEVFALTNALINPQLGAELNDGDSAMILLRTHDGKQCHINNSRAATYGYDQRIELLGTKGMLISANRRGYELQRFNATKTEQTEPYLYFFTERYQEAFFAELSAFIDSIQNETEPEVGFEDGRRALILAEAAQKSVIEERLVRVDEIA